MKWASHGEAVPVVTLDGLSLPACHLLKIDVEGMEREVPAGGRELIERCRPVIYLENDRAENSAELIRCRIGQWQDSAAFSA